MQLPFIVKRAREARELRELTQAEMMMVAGGDGGDATLDPYDCPDGRPPVYNSSIKCTSQGCQQCSADDPSCN